MRFCGRSLRLAGAPPPLPQWKRPRHINMVQVNPIPPPPPAALIATRKPTFREFVMYLVDQWRSHRRLDMHWTPINNFCTPCRIQPDIIAKFETLQVKLSYSITEILNLNYQVEHNELDWKKNANSASCVQFFNPREARPGCQANSLNQSPWFSPDFPGLTSFPRLNRVFNTTEKQGIWQYYKIKLIFRSQC